MESSMEKRPVSTMRHQVYQILKEEICRGCFAPGQWLQENELAARLHISTRTLARWKNAGIDALVDYYRYHRSRETREGSRGT